MRTAAPSHYVRHNKVTRIPRNFVYLDSEAYRELTAKGERQTFRLAVASHDRRRHDRDGWADRDTETFYDTNKLWGWVDGRTQARARTVVVAHNLSYDVRITDALSALPALGWTLKACRLDRGQAWFNWSRDGRSLALVDSFSWCPVALEKLGELVEIPKLPLPAWDDSDDAWEQRCARDVEILAAVWRRLMDWIREADLGNWKPTGAGQAWAAYRHRFMEHRLLAHDDVVGRATERRAAWAGRCEVWRHGRVHGGPFSEWDYSAAYAHVGAECDVPTKLVGASSSVTVDQWRALTGRFAVLAECEVTTEVPTVPTLIDGRICWPVGTFTTTCWENELELAIANGASVVVSRLWWYRRAPALRAFDQWLLEYLEPGQTGFDGVVVLAAKHWGRSLVGRFGARWSNWEDCGRAPCAGLGLSTVIDAELGERWSRLQVGHDLKRRTGEVDSPDSVVSIMSWVMAECRVRLWRVMELAGFENVCYVDTDGVIVTAAGSERLRSAEVPGLRRKGEWASLELLGPRQIIVGGKLRASGVPRGSIRVDRDTWEGEVWRELTSSLRAAEASSVTISRRTVHVRGVDKRRVHLDGGETAPRRVELDGVES